MSRKDIGKGRAERSGVRGGHTRHLKKTHMQRSCGGIASLKTRKMAHVIRRPKMQ